jgi:hypothetical protein
MSEQPIVSCDMTVSDPPSINQIDSEGVVCIARETAIAHFRSGKKKALPAI